MKAAIDEVTDKLQRELTELRDKRVAKRRTVVDPATGGDLPA
jgi:ribosome-associated translation inhibitor RaiA